MSCYHVMFLEFSKNVYLLFFRGTYIIDTNGIVRHMSVNDFSVGRSVDEILRLVQAFQFSDEHGQLCPSSWKPGADTVLEKNSSL